MECSTTARLLFIGIWNFCDDGGNHPASTKTLKAEVFPGDDIGAGDVAELVRELVEQGLLVEYESAGKPYWHVTGWHHQKIEKPSYKHPSPPEIPLPIGEDSPNSRRMVGDASPPEGSLKESKGKDKDIADEAIACPVAGKAADCPHQKIIDLYHELLPMGRQVRHWTDARKAKLRNRWREEKQRQSLVWWRKLFSYVAESEFLTGKVVTPGRKPFELDLEWLVTPANLVKVIEGKYHECSGGAA